jgi:branched-subunit amino acid transport protein AzlD
VNVLIAALLIGHALVHASYLSPAPPRTADGPHWPFEMARSWLVTRAGLDPALVRTLGTAMVIATVALFVAAGLSTVGWLVPPEWWPELIVVGATASAVTLVMFFHPWIVLGLAIDAALLWATLVIGWSPATASP